MISNHNETTVLHPTVNSNTFNCQPPANIPSSACHLANTNRCVENVVEIGENSFYITIWYIVLPIFILRSCTLKIASGGNQKKKVRGATCMPKIWGQPPDEHVVLSFNDLGQPNDEDKAIT